MKSKNNRAAITILVTAGVLLVSVCILGYYALTSMLGNRIHLMPSKSMEPTILQGSRFLADKKHFSDANVLPKRGEIVVFKYPLNRKQEYVKRIVGLPGERVAGVNGDIVVNGQPLVEDYISDKMLRDFDEVMVEAGHYFVLGDNRNQSSDSRVWGTVPREDIVGLVIIK